MKEQFLFIDFEFTMPDGKSKGIKFFPEIIEVGFVSVINDEINQTYSSFVKPLQFPTLSSRCKRFLNISQENVDHGIQLNELGEILNEATKNYRTTVITWGNMDMRVLKHNCEAANLSFPIHGEVRDLCLEYKTFFGNQNQTGLWNAMKEYGKDGTGNHHKALDDALTTYHIYKLVEKDKQYMKKPAPATLGDLIDFSLLKKRISSY
ncbi:3'-5' exonuclease KapD [Bacillus sp. AFS053548]|uniref:3'-5' exonuclease KapD n=1 Tax=Bacillus sp. AFS053548 TaxID=2033505 RepID=UPI000BFE54AD|nr:3'-5' exonuclease KapD [Bacillus sp. AFS053548]PGM56565.1 or 3'-5' exonuclease KapD [Bacillus sp. AFS053548]